jgi:hypothetical protein
MATARQTATAPEWHTVSDSCQTVVGSGRVIYKFTFSAQYTINDAAGDRTWDGFRLTVHGGGPDNSKSNVNFKVYNDSKVAFRWNSPDSLKYDTTYIVHHPTNTGSYGSLAATGIFDVPYHPGFPIPGRDPDPRCSVNIVFHPSLAPATATGSQTKEVYCQATNNDIIYSIIFDGVYTDDPATGDRTWGEFKFRLHGGGPENSKSNVEFLVYSNVNHTAYRWVSGDNVKFDRTYAIHHTVHTDNNTFFRGDAIFDAPFSSSIGGDPSCDFAG